MNVIHYGVGNIGRGFIAPILRKDQNIKEIKFVDINNDLIAKINKNKKYFVNEMQLVSEKILIDNISASTINEVFQKENETFLNNATLLTISIGQTNLKYIKDDILKLIDYKISNNQTLLIICCENGNRVSSYFKELLISNNNEFNNIYFIDAVVDRIVPNQSQEGLDVDVEKYYSWIVDDQQWPNDIKKITSINYSNKIDAEINKKICLLNGVHAAICWHNYNNDKFKTITTVQQALKQEDTMFFLEELFAELTVIIAKMYDFELSYLINYKNQLLNRFNNKYLIDELSRVGRNPISKLQKSERILTPLLYAIKNNLKHQKLLEVFNNALNYWYVDDQEGQILCHSIKEIGIEKTIIKLIPNLNDEEISLLISKPELTKNN